MIICQRIKPYALYQNHHGASAPPCLKLAENPAGMTIAANKEIRTQFHAAKLPVNMTQ